MSQSLSEDDYLPPIVPLEVLNIIRRTSIFSSKDSRVSKFIKPKTTLFGSLPKLSSRSRAKVLWDKLRRNVVCFFIFLFLVERIL